MKLFNFNLQTLTKNIYYQIGLLHMTINSLNFCFIFQNLAG